MGECSEWSSAARSHEESRAFGVDATWAGQSEQSSSVLALRDWISVTYVRPLLPADGASYSRAVDPASELEPSVY